METIELYFNDQLSTNEKAAFEERLKTDMQLAQDVAFYLQAKQAAKLMAQEERLRGFETIRRNSKTKNTKVVSLWPTMGMVAAACVVLVGVWVFSFNTLPTNELAANYIQNNLSQLPTTMGMEEDSLYIGVRLYNDKKYREALSIFENMKTKDQNEDTFRVEYKGLTHLQLGLYDESIKSFQKLAQDKAIVNNKGVFYEALALMKQNKEGNIERVKMLLNQVIEQNLGNRAEAKDLLEEIK